MERKPKPARKPILNGVRAYMDAMAALCAVQFLFAVDMEITHVLDGNNPMFLLANWIEPYLGLAAPFEIFASWIFGVAAGSDMTAATSGKLGFYLMTPLVLASFTTFAAEHRFNLAQPSTYMAATFGYFILYGFGFYMFAATWPIFLWGILFKLTRSHKTRWPTLYRDTWRAVLFCLLAIAAALLLEVL